MVKQSNRKFPLPFHQRDKEELREDGMIQRGLMVVLKGFSCGAWTVKRETQWDQGTLISQGTLMTMEASN